MGGMPEVVVRIANRVDAIGIHRVLDAPQDSIAGTRARRQPDGRIHCDVVALVCSRCVLGAFPMRAAFPEAVEGVEGSGLRIREDAGTVYDLGLLRMPAASRLSDQ
jgi:hypothetical protein